MPTASGCFERHAMSRLPSPNDLADPQTRRALELDALSAILPMDRRDRLAGLLPLVFATVLILELTTFADAASRARHRSQSPPNRTHITRAAPTQGGGGSKNS
jgi:hypothetical protein